MSYINFKGLIGLVIILCCFGKNNNAIAQDSDMERDLTVIEAVITEIVNSEFKQRDSFSSKKAKASYVEGRGILIKIPSLNNYSNSWSKGFITIEVDDDEEDDEDIIVNSNSVSSISGQVSEDKKEELLEKIEKAMRTFLVNYGDLARELPENEKIILLYKRKKQSSYRVISGNSISIGSTYNSNNDESVSQFSAEVLKSDITKFKSGKLSENQFWEKVDKKKITTKESEKEKLEFNVLSKIFESRLAQHKHEINDGDDNVLIINHFGKKVDYEVVSGVGVVYTLNVNVPFPTSSVYVKGWNKQKKKEKLEELTEKSDQLRKETDEKVEDLVNELLEDIREDMISYGRTLRSLSQDEMLIVEFNLPKCYECDLPATYQFSVSKKVLEQYENRKLDLNSAMEKIIEKEEGKAKDTRGLGNFYFDWKE